MKTTIVDEMKRLGLQEDMIREEDAWMLQSLSHSNPEIDSVYGNKCMKIIDAAASMMELIHPICHGRVWQAVLDSIDVEINAFLED